MIFIVLSSSMQGHNHYSGWVNFAVALNNCTKIRQKMKSSRLRNARSRLYFVDFCVSEWHNTMVLDVFFFSLFFFAFVRLYASDCNSNSIVCVFVCLLTVKRFDSILLKIYEKISSLHIHIMQSLMLLAFPFSGCHALSHFFCSTFFRFILSLVYLSSCQNLFACLSLLTHYRLYFGSSIRFSVVRQSF